MTDRCELCGDELELERGRMSIRHSAASDGPQLVDLYERLGVEDIHRRFFTSARPSGEFFHRWAAVADDGGFGLVVVLEHEESSSVIAEAGYGPVTDGTAEFGIAVDPGHRGWLGSWLLDALFQHARARGLENLEAMVLTDNAAMMAMARKRGYAVVGHPDWGLVHVRLSTDGPVPSWTGPHDRPRVLVESRHIRTPVEEQLREEGYDVILCPGPCHGLAKCPVLAGEACPLIADADAVVVELPGDNGLQGRLVHEEALVHPGTRFVSAYENDDELAEAMGSPAGRRRIPPAELVATLDELLKTKSGACD